MALNTRNTLLLAKPEVTPGVDSLPTEALDAIRAAELTITPNPNIVNTNEFSGSLEIGEDIVGGVPMTVSFTTFLRGSGAAGTIPDLDPLFRAASFTSTVVASTSVTYALTSTRSLIPTLTIYGYRDGLLWRLVGCRAQTMAITWTSSQAISIAWSFLGRFLNKVDAAVPASPVFDATTPPIWLSSTFTIDAAAAALQALVLNVNNTVVLPDNPNDVEGFDAAEITGRRVDGTMNPLEVLVATRDLFANFKTNVTTDLQAIVGGTAGNIWTMNVDTAKLINEQEGDRDGLLIADYPFQAIGGDAAVEIVST